MWLLYANSTIGSQSAQSSWWWLMNTEVGFDFLVNMLGLAVSLWVMGSGRGESDSKQCC